MILSVIPEMLVVMSIIRLFVVVLLLKHSCWDAPMMMMVAMTTMLTIVREQRSPYFPRMMMIVLELVLGGNK